MNAQLFRRGRGAGLVLVALADLRRTGFADLAEPLECWLNDPRARTTDAGGDLLPMVELLFRCLRDAACDRIGGPPLQEARRAHVLEILKLAGILTDQGAH